MTIQSNNRFNKYAQSLEEIEIWVKIYYFEFFSAHDVPHNNVHGSKISFSQ